MAGKLGVDNGQEAVKLAMRQSVVRELDPSGLVLETCTGEGRMHDAVWFRFRGVTCDINELKAASAARLRPQWLCVHGDAVSLCETGAFDDTPFSVLDFDFYGSPWPACLAYLRTHRAWPAGDVHLFLTDGFASKANIAGQDRALFPGAGRSLKTTPAMVWAQAQRAIAEALEPHGRALRVRASHSAAGMSYHHVVAGQP